MKFKSFKTLANYLDSVPCINAGGCGVSAFFIYKYFKEKESELAKPEIVFGYNSGDSNWEVNNKALAGQCSPSSCSHVMVKFNGVYYDSTGAHVNPNYCGWFDKQHVVSEEFLLKALANRGKWNSMFDRDQELPKMEKKIGVSLPTS